jgi:hypothetical protein
MPNLIQHTYVVKNYSEETVIYLIDKKASTPREILVKAKLSPKQTLQLVEKLKAKYEDQSLPQINRTVVVRALAPNEAYFHAYDEQIGSIKPKHNLTKK